MVTVTTRDKIWTITLAYLCRHRSFRLGDLPIDESERITAQRVWRVMAHMGFLKRHEGDPKTWHRGPMADIMLYPESVNEIQWDDEQDRIYI